MFRWLHGRRRLVLGSLLAALLAVGLFGRSYLALIPQGRARSCIAGRRFDDARWWLGWARALSADNAETELLAARLARRTGDVPAVDRHLRRAAELGCPEDRVRRQQWLTLAQTGHMEQAEPHLWELLGDDRGQGPEILEAYLVGFAIANQKGRAREMAETWVQAFPDDPQPHLYWAAIEEDEEAWDAALQRYRAALDRREDHPPALLGAGGCLLEKKLPAEALECYRQAERAGAQPWEAVVGQVRCLRELGRGDEARQRLERAAADVRRHPRAVLLAAQLEVDAGQYEEAADKLERLIQRRPRNLEARFVYAAALRGSGRGGEALEHIQYASTAKQQLEQARALKKRAALDLDDMFLIGHALIKYGDAAEGAYWLTRVVEQVPGHKRAHRALAQYYEEAADENRDYEGLARRHRRLADS